LFVAPLVCDTPYCPSLCIDLQYPGSQKADKQLVDSTSMSRRRDDSEILNPVRIVYAALETDNCRRCSVQLQDTHEGAQGRKKVSARR
jgi:hypothetical protein